MTAASDGGGTESGGTESGGAGSGGTGGADAGRRLVDEALRFVEALRDADGSGRADGAGSADHTGPECRVCPVCRVIAAVRTLRPEAVEHLALAAAELATAWREVVAGAQQGPPPQPTPREEPCVQPIIVTD